MSRRNGVLNSESGIFSGTGKGWGNIITDHFPLILITLLAFLYRILNAEGYPLPTADEHVYIARGWSFVHFLALDVYPLESEWDHPPLGWILPGLIANIFPAPFEFYSYRWAMALITIINVPCIYILVRKLSGCEIGGYVAAAAYGLSPGIVIFSRYILLDNTATVFMMAAGVAAVENRRKFVALFIGAMLLTKYVYALFIPLLVLIDFTGADTPFKSTENGDKPSFLKSFIGYILNRDVLLYYFVVPLLFFSIWPLTALFFGSFFPEGSHQSMLIRFLAQIFTRSDNLPFWAPGSSFSAAYSSVFAKLPLLFVSFYIILITGIGASTFGYIYYKKYGDVKIINRIIRLLSIMVGVIPYILFLLRGGIVYFFYFIPLFPLMFIVISVFPFYIFGILKRTISRAGEGRRPLRSLRQLNRNINAFIVPGTVMILMTVSSMYTPPVAVSDSLGYNSTVYLSDLYAWIINNIPRDAVCATTMELYPELVKKGYTGIYLYYRCNSYDKLFNTTVLKGDWRNIDYFIVNPSINSILNSEFYIKEGVLLTAWNHTVELASFGTGNARVTVYKVIHTE